MADRVKFLVREAGLAAARSEEGAVEGGEQPGFRFRAVSQLVAFGRPHVEGVLGQVAGFMLSLGEAEREAVERLVEPLDQLFKFLIVHVDERFRRWLYSCSGTVCLSLAIQPPTACSGARLPRRVIQNAAASREGFCGAPAKGGNVATQ